MKTLAPASAFVLMLLLAGPGLAASAAAWKVVEGPEDAFTVKMPGAAKHTRETMKSAKGTAYAMDQYLLEKGPAAYIVQTAVYPEEVDVSDPKVTLNNGLKNAAKNMRDGKWDEERELKHLGLDAAHAIGVRKGNAIASYSVLVGRRIITLTYAGPPGSAKGPDAERFIGSLALASRP